VCYFGWRVIAHKTDCQDTLSAVAVQVRTICDLRHGFTLFLTD
jgi:hypothetical protein